MPVFEDDLDTGIWKHEHGSFMDAVVIVNLSKNVKIELHVMAHARPWESLDIQVEIIEYAWIHRYFSERAKSLDLKPRSVRDLVHVEPMPATVAPSA